MRDFKREGGRIVAPGVGDQAPAALERWVREQLKRPDSFAYFGERKEMFETWALGPCITHRDADAVDRSNAQALKKFLKSDPSLDEDWECDKASHWAVGWVEHLSFRAVEEDRKTPTRIARILCAWFTYLRDMHPVADEDLLSTMEDEEAHETWANCYDVEERIEYIRQHRYQFEFRTFADLLGCVRGKYFAGYASELIYR